MPAPRPTPTAPPRSVPTSLALAIVGVGALAGAVHAAPAVDVNDLPPLPSDSDAPSSAATLLAASAAEEDVVVGAAKREQSLGSVASAVTVITADRIRRFGYRTVVEAIAAVAGFYFEDNRLVASVGIRGMFISGDYNTRILVLVDGATINETWGAFAGIGFDGMISIDEVARIEVIRGPVGAVYGANAFFGIINIVTRGTVEGTAAWGRVGLHSIQGEIATAGFATGSVHRQLRGSVLAANRIGDTTSVPGLGTDLASDGSYSLVGAIAGSYDGSFAQIRVNRHRRESPFAPYDGDPDLDPAYAQYNTQLLVEGGHTRDVTARLTLAGRGYANIYRYYDRILYAADDTFQDNGAATTFGAELRGRYAVLEDGRLGLTAGGEANHNRTKSRSFTLGMESSAIVVPLDFNIEGAYLELDGQPRPWLGFTGGVRFDRNSAIDRRLSPRGALFLAKPERYGLKLLYAEGFRNPSAFEGAFDDGTDFTANPDIRSERIRSLETVLWARPRLGVSTRLSAFYWDARDVVEQVLLPTNLLQFQNIGRYVTQGVEFEASYRNSEGWYAFGGAAVTRVGTAASGSEVVYGDVQNAPVIVAAGGVSTPKLWGWFHLSNEATLIGRRATRPAEDGTPSPDSPGWLGWNTTLYAPDLRGFDVTIGVRNLLGRRDLLPAPGDYDRTLDTDGDGMPDATLVIPRIPGEARELFVKVGYAY